MCVYVGPCVYESTCARPVCVCVRALSAITSTPTTVEHLSNSRRRRRRRLLRPLSRTLRCCGGGVMRARACVRRTFTVRAAVCVCARDRSMAAALRRDAALRLARSRTLGHSYAVVAEGRPSSAAACSSDGRRDPCGTGQGVKTNRRGDGGSGADPCCCPEACRTRERYAAAAAVTPCRIPRRYT